MATQPSQKILRIGVIQNGRIIEERLLRTRETVTVGQGTRNTFVLASDVAPATQVLFEASAGKYILHFTEQMAGRLSLGDAVYDLTVLRQSGKARQAGREHVVELDERSRGKVVIGDVTILFQFVNPPPLRVAPQLPANMRGGLILFLASVAGFNGFFLIAFLISSIGQGGLVAFLVLLVPPPPRTNVMDAPPDAFVSILTERPEEPPPPPELDTDEIPEEDPNAEAVPVPDAPPDRPREPEQQQRDNTPQEPRTNQEIRDAARDRVVEQSALGALFNSDNGVGPALEAVRQTSSLTAADIIANQAAAGTGTGIVSSTGLGSDGAATSNVGRADIGGGGGSSVAASAQVADTTQQAAQQVEVRTRIRGSEERTAGTGTLSSSNIASVFRRREGDIRRCYERGVSRDPGLRGRIVIQLTIGDGGRVDDVRLRENELGEDVGTCIVGAVRRWRFESPQGGTVQVQKAYILAPGS